MTSIFATTRALRFPTYRNWLLETNLWCITTTERSLDQYQFRATLTWRWFRQGVEPADAARKLAHGEIR
jgi:hypothetical protein